VRTIGVAAFLAVGATTWAKAGDVEWVTIGDPRNTADAGEFGGVDGVYAIMKYEVTAGDYLEFLNAVAATDSHNLYNSLMDSEPRGCQITQVGESGSFTYDFSGGAVEAPDASASDWSNRPVNYVSLYDAMRFANWMHNGQPGLGQPAPQDENSTEDGAYDMSLGASAKRKAGAAYFVPDEDEWYKAAYHKNNTVTSDYSAYPTCADEKPGNDITQPDSGNNANFCAESNNPNDLALGPPFYRTPVGQFENSASCYGTFDQAGNVWEWIEDTSGVVRGGSWASYVGDPPNKDTRITEYDPDLEFYDFGFRLASSSRAVPATSTWSLAVMLCLGLIVGTLSLRSRAVTQGAR